jgi:hypothetical protein
MVGTLILERVYASLLVSQVQNSMAVQSTARQTIQNCPISPVDFQTYCILHKAQI